MKTMMLLLFAAALGAQPSDETEVRHLMTDFLTAFENLDWSAFRKCWIDKPEVFFPSQMPNSTGKRTDDVTGFESAWHRQFDAIRDAALKRNVTKPPFQKIEPKDMRIDFPAPTVAVVTFHLDLSDNHLGRRTFVVVKTSNGWKITHLHASTLALKTE